jgi:hypothetical protein
LETGAFDGGEMFHSFAGSGAGLDGGIQTDTGVNAGSEILHAVTLANDLLQGPNGVLRRLRDRS